MNINPILLKDFYKVGHIHQYPENTSLIFNNFTPRKSRMPGINHSIFFGLNYFIQKYLSIGFGEFFNRNGFKKEYMAKLHATNYQTFINKTLGEFAYPDHIGELHKLGYLPIAIYSLPELSIVPCGVPALVMFNTHPDFYWLPNMLETLLSCTLWSACTSATIAREYRILLNEFANRTCDDNKHIDYQAHDFSFRGMSSVESACISGMAHLQYFKGTDTIPAILYDQFYYDNPFHIASVPATEHSVMSAGGKENEFETFNRLLDLYPTGILSIVSDTWDLWKVISNILPKLRDKIIARDGKIVIRPDSGDPVDIICGYNWPEWRHSGMSDDNHPSRFGVIEALWDIFGGSINDKGFRVLNPHIGCIYGDSITLDRAKNILSRLANKGFASSNIVFGIGSYTYQYNTRDTLGWAMKATYAEVDGIGRAITKNPITDDGTKKSHSGILKVIQPKGAHGYGDYQVLQNQTWEQFYQNDNALLLRFKNGEVIDD